MAKNLTETDAIMLEQLGYQEHIVQSVLEFLQTNPGQFFTLKDISKRLMIQESQLDDLIQKLVIRKYVLSTKGTKNIVPIQYYWSEEDPFSSPNEPFIPSITIRTTLEAIVFDKGFFLHFSKKYQSMLSDFKWPVAPTLFLYTADTFQIPKEVVDFGLTSWSDIEPSLLKRNRISTGSIIPLAIGLFFYVIQKKGISIGNRDISRITGVNSDRFKYYATRISALHS